ncbi:flagellin, partial [Bacillus pumilus]|uniref:flagellin n=1 Tax=Bacillus pumilus TaxID=1408 RepID=UPI0034D956BB
MKQLSHQPSKLPPLQNPLHHTINNLPPSPQNLTPPHSPIPHLHIPKQITHFTNNNILSQPSQPILAQPNQQPQNLL